MCARAPMAGFARYHLSPDVGRTGADIGIEGVAFHEPPRLAFRTEPVVKNGLRGHGFSFFGMELFTCSGAFLPDADHACKFADSHQPLLLCRSIGFVQPVRDDQLHVCCQHLCGLLFTDARLDGQQVFVPDSFCFVENLPPTVFAGPFGCQHRQVFRAGSFIVIGSDVREDEVRFVATLCFAAARVINVEFGKKI